MLPSNYDLVAIETKYTCFRLAGFGERGRGHQPGRQYSWANFREDSKQDKLHLTDHCRAKFAMKFLKYFQLRVLKTDN